jgi:hypothetical protein
MRALGYQEKSNISVLQSREQNLDISRQDYRHRIKENAAIDSPNNGCHPAELIDISLHGCCLFGPNDLVKGQIVTVRICDLPGIEGKIRWARKRTLGVEFLQALQPQALESIRYRLIAS